LNAALQHPNAGRFLPIRPSFIRFLSLVAAAHIDVMRPLSRVIELP
jgi:hypothetical protein